MSRWSLLFAVPVLLCISSQLTAQLAEDFETGMPPGWHSDGLWHVTGACPRPSDCNPIQWAYFGQDGSCDFATGSMERGTLEPPPITLLPGLASLTYCSAYDGEGGTFYDKATVEVNDGTFVDGPMVSAPDWVTHVVDLSAYAGRTVRLVWSFDTVDSGFNVGLGWQVDDIVVTDIATSNVLLQEDFEFGLNNTWWTSGLWHATSACPRPSATCDGGSVWAYYGLDATCNFDTGVANSGVMVTPVLTIPAAGATLTYCSAYDGEGGAPYDRATVEVLTVVDGPLASTSGTPDWEVRNVDLSLFAGHAIQLIFRFETIDFASNGHLGWQVDDVAVDSGIPCSTTGTVYSDRTLFNADNPGLPVEDFEESLVAPGDFQPCAAPVDENSVDCFQPGEILPGVLFTDIPVPDPVDGLVVLGDDFSGNTSIVLTHFDSTDDFRIEFPGNDVHAVGMDVVAPFSPQDVIVRVYGLGGVLLCVQSTPGTAAGEFWGIYSDEIITAIELAGPTDYAGCDNIAFGVGTPPIPINDDCDDALPIFDGVTPYTNLGATSDGPVACSVLGSDVWYLYEATCSGYVTIETCGFATYDTVLAVYEAGSCPPVVEIACNDDGCSALRSRVRFGALAGDQFLVQVGGYTGQQGNGELFISCDPAPFADECFTPIPIVNGTTVFDTTLATDSGMVPCGNIGSDIWYSYEATCTGTVTVTTCNDANFDTVLAVYDGLGCPPTSGALLACNNDAGGCGTSSTITFDVLQGFQYLIQLGGVFGASGVGFVTVGCEAYPCEPTLPYLTHSASREIANLVVGCGSDDSFWRTFDLASLGVAGEIDVTNVEIAVWVSAPAGPTQDIAVRLYADADDVPAPVAELTLLGEETFPIGPLVETQLCLDFSAPIAVPASVTNLVVEVANASGDFLGLGMNSLGESDESYISTVVCSTPEPVSWADLGFPDIHMIMYVFYEESALFIRGDADGNGLFNGLVDGLYILDHQFQGGPPPPCYESGDADGNGLFNGLVDGVYVLNHQFNGGPPPPLPYPVCGPDPDPLTSLGCGDHSGCP